MTCPVLPAHLSTVLIAFENKTIAFCFCSSDIGIQVGEKAAESPKVSLLLSRAPHSLAGLLSDEKGAKGRAETFLAPAN